LWQQAKEDLMSRSRIGELARTVGLLPAPNAELVCFGSAKPLILKYRILADPLQGLALRATGNSLAVIGFDQMHVGAQSGNEGDLEFFANAPLAS
jgi:hypothetical protein